MTHAHETLLRTKCNYTGAQPYWDEERDASHFANSSIFDAEGGFGGREAGCVRDGVFKDYELIIGPGKNNTKHCLERAIDDVASQAASKFFLDFVRNSTTFEEAWERIEFYPHSAGHSGVGGEVSYFSISALRVCAAFANNFGAPDVEPHLKPRRSDVLRPSCVCG